MSGKTVRAEVLERDGNRCKKCGIGDSKGNPLTVHHIIFKSQGGKYTLENLITWCWNCHKAFHAEYSLNHHKTKPSKLSKIHRIFKNPFRHKKRRR